MNEVKTVRETIKAHIAAQGISMARFSVQLGLARSYLCNALNATPYLAALAVAGVIKFEPEILEWAESEKIAAIERSKASRTRTRPVIEVQVYPVSWQRWARA